MLNLKLSEKQLNQPNLKTFVSMSSSNIWATLCLLLGWIIIQFEQVYLHSFSLFVVCFWSSSLCLVSFRIFQPFPGQKFEWRQCKNIVVLHLNKSSEKFIYFSYSKCDYSNHINPSHIFFLLVTECSAAHPPAQWL